ncbi:MAG: hypothetical protein WCL16_14300 [bacterium]
MTNAEKLLAAVDQRLSGKVDLTLYGRAALQLGFPNPPLDYALSRDVDAVMWIGQAEELLARTNFWAVIEEVNALFADQELYISHFFEDSQVILTADWLSKRLPIHGQWNNLSLYRLGNEDLFLSKLMRDDPIDRMDAMFIIKSAPLSSEHIRRAIQTARIPPVPEIAEQFKRCAKRFQE